MMESVRRVSELRVCAPMCVCVCVFGRGDMGEERGAGNG